MVIIRITSFIWNFETLYLFLPAIPKAETAQDKVSCARATIEIEYYITIRMKF